MSKFTLKSMLTAILMCLAVGGFAQVADGDYYLYNAEAKQFLSRGEDWGTRACVDKYGIPFTWNSTEGSLKFLDNELYLFETNDNCIYTDNQSTGFSLEEATDGYYLKSAKSGSYITLQAGTYLHQILMPTSDQTAASVWTLKTKAERDEIVAAYANANYENVIAAAGISATADNFLTVLSMATAVDMTSSIGTASFSGGIGDWVYTGVRTQGGQPVYGNGFCESWVATGYLTQTVSNLPEGIYKITMNGYERPGTNAQSETWGAAGYDMVTSALVANDEEVALKSWYTEMTNTDGVYVPNNTGEAVAKFTAGGYLNELYVYVGADGQLKLTVDKHNYIWDKWVCFNNFTLTRYAPFELEMSPLPGMTDKLEEITLTFAEEVDCNDEAVVTVVSAETGESVTTGSLSYDYTDNAKITLKLNEAITTLGNYNVVIPAGSIWATENEARTIKELTYTYNVDPDYWDPEKVMEISGTTEDAPVALIAGRKYQFNDMYTYATYTAEEDGRLYFEKLDEHWVDLTLRNEYWYNQGELGKTEDGKSWVGVAAGQTVYIQDYNIISDQYMVTFEAGTPYDAIQYLGSYPTDGGLLSKSTEAPKSYEMGTVEFYFSTKVNKEVLKVYMIIPSQNNKKIEITDDVQLVSGTPYGSSDAYLGVVMETCIDLLKEENGLKAGDKVVIALENVQDINFAANVLAENPQVEVVLAATVCTSINPSPNYGGVDSIPGTLSLRFDGDVTCTNGKGWIIDVKSGNKQEFAIENLTCEAVETWSGAMVYDAEVTLPEATVELTSKLFNIQLEGLVDAEGNTVAYGDEADKFIIEYQIRDDNFNYVSVDPEEGDVTSIKTTKLTFDDTVNLIPNAEEYPYVWVGDNEVTGTLAVDPNDEKSVIVTWNEEITAAGQYSLNIPKGLIYDSKFDASKEDYGLADGAGHNPYISLNYAILADVSATTTVASITPAAYEGWGSQPINNLPDSVVITFNGNVKEVVNAYGVIKRGGWSTRSTEIPADADSLAVKLEDNKVIVTIPAEIVAAVTSGNYNITVNAIGEDDKVIGLASDPYAENITFQYYVYKTLGLVEAVPADGETVKELSTVTLTFDGEIIELDGSYSAPCLLNTEWDKVADFTYTFSGNQITLTASETVTTAGEYIIYIPGEFAYGTGWITNNMTELYVTVDPNHVDALALTSATPENGSAQELLTSVTFTLNKEVGYLHESSLLPSDNGDDAATASLTKNEDGSYTLDFTYGGFMAGATLRDGITYTMTLDAYSSEDAYNYESETPETVTLTYVGAAKAYEFSSVELVSITPNEETVIADASQNTIVVTFSGAVTIDEALTFVNLGQGATQPFASITANEDKTVYTLTFPADYLNSLVGGYISVSIAANDAEGKRVKGDSGVDEKSYFSYEFVTTIGVPDLKVTPAEAVAELESISISCESGLAPSWTAGNITLVDAEGNTIALNDPEAVVAEGAGAWDTPTEWTVALQEKLTTKGTYTLTIPTGYFNIGSTQGQSVNSKETVVTITIDPALGIRGITIDADTEVTVYNVAGVLVAKGKASDVMSNLTKGLYIVNGKKVVVK